MTTTEKLLKQVELQEEIQHNSKINIVSCGNCGDVFLHRIAVIDINCPYCDFTSDPCDFPDLLHRGIL